MSQGCDCCAVRGHVYRDTCEACVARDLARTPKNALALAWRRIKRNLPWDKLERITALVVVERQTDEREKQARLQDARLRFLEMRERLKEAA